MTTRLFLLAFSLVCIGSAVFYFASGQAATAMLTLVVAAGTLLLGLLVDPD